MKMFENRRNLFWGEKKKSLRSTLLETQMHRKQILSNKIAIVLRMIQK